MSCFMPLAFLAEEIEQSVANNLCKHGKYILLNERSKVISFQSNHVALTWRRDAVSPLLAFFIF